MLPHNWSRPDQSRYYDAMARAERTDEQLRDERAVVCGQSVLAEKNGSNEHRSTAPVLERSEELIAEMDRKRTEADERFWKWYVGTLEKRGRCLCPSCHTKVERFGQYCDKCKF